jgi:hypothetical protein
MAQQMLVELRPNNEVDHEIAEKFDCAMYTAASIRRDAWAEILKEDTTSKKDHFSTIVGALRRLYNRALASSHYGVCLGVIRQLREMFDLIKPLALVGESGTFDEGKKEFSGRSNEELQHFLTHGTWPEEAPQREPEEERVGANPLDDL